jgi:hypothetical protein
MADKDRGPVRFEMKAGKKNFLTRTAGNFTFGYSGFTLKLQAFVKICNIRFSLNVLTDRFSCHNYYETIKNYKAGNKQGYPLVG